MSVYQPGIPTGAVPLDQDYKNLKNNFGQLDITFGIDHLKFSNNTQQNGFHQAIHIIPTSTPTTNPPNNYVAQPATQVTGQPINTPGFGQLFSATIKDGFATDQALFWQTGTGGRIQQLTSNFTPNVSDDSTVEGVTFLPGGFILQWGHVTNTSGNPFVTYRKSFPNACFAVTVTRQNSSTTPLIPGLQSFGFWVLSSPNKDDFTIFNGDGGISGGWSYNWMAIGN